MGKAPGSSPPCPARREGRQEAGLRAVGWIRGRTPGDRVSHGAACPQDLGQSQASAQPGSSPHAASLYLPSAQACFDLGAKGSAAFQAHVALWEMLPPNACVLGLLGGEVLSSSESLRQWHERPRTEELSTHPFG